ncbi:hypothetical protein PHYSODRAFT_325841 [Phytophthora sojae]|uniref:Uncharacterized protein n=1 Tax=Phytophthora sojae (strain P6497) TaxID=1094619 RepID=G4YS60_PHYSP|nr:hypothetical protein PHYSODRAFT_325841 [Phytophthora sojae]EGZ24761.1 hypothetical protein PHYSODRAFT_325841 [Phytophthora sojae]|eukprot:XP_009520049.1 hypothetical protein PHYSODRAFT_325841 [Phytophthora sojae]
MSEAKKRRVEGVRGVQEPQAAMQLLTSVCVVCRDDPRIDALSHVTDLIDAYVDYSIHWTLPNAVKKATSAHLVKRLLGRMDSLNEEDRRLQLEHAIEYAAAMGSLPFTQQLHENLSTFPIRLDYEVAVAAALSGDLPLLKWLKANEPSLFGRPESWAEQVAFDAASERGCLETVQWLVETFPDAAWSLAPAALGGHLNVVQWLHQHATLDGVQLNFPEGTTVFVE